MSDHPTYTPRLIQLPAVLQITGCAPFFGMIASMSEQGLAFDFQAGTPAPHTVGSKAILDFNFLGLHHSCNTLFIHIRGSRALLSLRDATPTVLAALAAVNPHNMPPLASGLWVLQQQHTCHVQFMAGMDAVVNGFYRQLPDEIEKLGLQAISVAERSRLIDLQARLTQLRPLLTQQFTQAFPLYPEQHASYAESRKSDLSLELVDIDLMDDWMRRTTIARRIDDAITPWPHEFNRHYNTLLKNDYTQLAHPYHPESVLNVFADLIGPLGLDTDQRIFCYKLMGQALEKTAATLYPAMIQVLGVVPDDILAAPKSGTSLATWLETSAQVPDSDAPHLAATAAQVTELSALLARLVHHPDTPGMAQADTERRHTACPVVPALLARDRIMERFLPASPALADTAGPHFTAPDASAFGQTLGDLSGLDSTAMEGLRAQLQQPPPIDSGPDRLPETSQIRALMLQAQGLVLQYTLNGLSYQAQPDHPAWTLLNELDALRRGADDHGQFLDPALHKAASLAMQWLLEQENIDTALEQVNALLTKINAQLHEEQQSRREQYLHTLGEPAPDDSPIDTDWCVIKRDEEAIPYEVLGKFDEKYALLNQSATRLLEIPAQQFVEELDSGLIEEAGNFNQSFLERTANATLAASLNAIHTYTWQDPASGCLKRAALMDELERRLAHPVSAPPTCCALIEIPTMRPGPSLLPGDELAVLQKRSGELLLEMTERGEQCGRLSDVSFMIVFSPQDPHRVANRLGQLKTRMEDLHPSWKMNGAIVPLVDTATSPTPSDVLRRANQACSSMRQHAELALTCLSNAPPAAGQIDPLPFSSLYLRCQKIASCVEGALPHYEILLGIDEDLIPHHSSQSFVVMAEQVGNIHLLDTWVLQSALEWMDRDTSALDHLSGLSVNLSGNSLTLADHVGAIVNLLAGYPHLTNKLILEVTETAAIDNLDVAVRSLRKLRTLGCRIALDDFGSGYSSYGYLRNLPLDYLKIDGTYIRNILTDKTDQALTASMVDVAHALGLKVIAEYVDSEAAYAWLKALGVDYVQGYWVHEPQRLDTLLMH